MNWVFGYGSLMWRPDFDHLERQPALLEGYSRAFCRLSFRHRGTPENPGMVLGLVEGGQCQGYAFRFSEENRSAILEKLDEREGTGYRRERLEIRIQSNGTVSTAEAFVYLPIKSHPTHAPDLTELEQARLIASGKGISGTARDYLKDLIRMLAEMNVQEPALNRLLATVENMKNNGSG